MRVYFIILLMVGLLTACVTAPNAIPATKAVSPTKEISATHTLFATKVIPNATEVITTFYVSTTGSDSNPGTLSQPYKTIQKGVNGLVAGDTLYVRGGTYTERINIYNSGTSSAPIVISSYPGETAKFDGSGLDSQLPKDTRIVDLYGSYIVFENFELTYPNGRGILVIKNTTGQNASHNIIRNLNVHHTWGPGIGIFGDNNIVENNRVWQTNLSNKASPGSSNWGAGLFFGDSTNPYFGLNTIVRNNEVYQNYGEGILCMYTDHALIEGNRVWDNWALGIYPDQCSYTTIDNNFIYYTNNHEFWRYPTHPHVGILISNEGLIASHPIGHDRTIVNNIIINAYWGINFWTGFASGSAFINDTIDNNTVVDNASYGGLGILINAPKDTNHRNTIIEDNLFLMLTGRPGEVDTITGLTFTNNLWSKTPYSTLTGTGDIIADPLLVNPTQTINLDQITYPLDAAGYAPSSSSPAIDKAKVVAGLTVDYFGNNRGTSPDIGAIEYMGTPSPTNTTLSPTASQLDRVPDF